MSTCEVGGKSYETQPDEGLPCKGCAAENSVNLCHALPGCTKVVWVEKRATVAAPAAGRKDDGGKLDVTLFFDDLPFAIEAVTEVLQWAVTKKQPTPYERGSWQGVDDFQRRYRAAQLRHELNRAKALKGNAVPTGEPTDAETGLMELAHIATDALFRLEMAVRHQKGIK
jgi:hypothetical protein